MNSCVYCVDTGWDNTVAVFPQFVLRSGGFVMPSIFIRFLSQISSIIFTLREHSSPHYTFASQREWSQTFSAFPQSLLLLLLFIYKKG